MNVVILDNLRSAWNVGSVFRTALALGYEELALCGVTMTPPSPKLRETSRGAEEKLPWRAFPQTMDAVKAYQERGYHVVALETGPQSIAFDQWEAPESKIAWVLGNEAKGLPSEIIHQCDVSVVLPILSEQASINVSCAFAAAAYGLHFKSV